MTQENYLDERVSILRARVKQVAHSWDSPCKPIAEAAFAEIRYLESKIEEAARMVDHIKKEGGGTYGDAIRSLLG